MQFTTLPEPVIYTSHVLSRTPILYRFDAADRESSIVLTEYGNDRRPKIELNGPSDKTQWLFRFALERLESATAHLLFGSCDLHEKPPVFTLDLRPGSSFICEYRSLISGFANGEFHVQTYGRVLAIGVPLLDDLKVATQRLREIYRVHYRM